MTAPTHEKKNLTNDFSFYPAWVAPVAPVLLRQEGLNITSHTPWATPVKESQRGDEPAKARERYAKRYLPKL